MKLVNNWYNILQYTILLLTVAAVPIHWRVGLLSALLLVITTLVKIIVQHKVGNPMVSRSMMWALLGSAIYWMALAISLFWSHDIVTGQEVLLRNAVLLCFSLCILISDTSYLTSRQLRGMGYVLLVATCGAFVYFLVKVGVATAQSIDFVSFYEDFYSHSRNGYRHHAYIAMYAVVAMVFVYHELYTYWKKLTVWHRCLLLFSMALLLSYVVLVNSRAGIIVMGVSMLTCIVHLLIKKRSWKLGVGIAALLLFCIVGVTKSIPTYADRVSETVANVEEDIRYTVYRCNWQAIRSNLVVGYGVGDAHAIQVETYKNEGFNTGAQAGLNAHNQYMESMLQAGLLGVLSLLFFLLSPLVVALCRHSRYTFIIAVFTCIVMMNLLFESMLERQMGLLFIGGLYAVMVLMMCVEEKEAIG